MPEQAEYTQGNALLGYAWFAALQELVDIVTMAESAADRIAAGDVILRYFVSLGQSINDPYIPADDDEEDDDDE